MSIDVAHFEAGDYVVAEFRELSPSEHELNRLSGMYEVVKFGQPTGRTYILEGELKDVSSALDARKSLSMPGPNSQCVRQANGSPGGNLVRIISHRHKGATA